MAQRDRQAQLAHIASLCEHNAHALYQALNFCHSHGIKAFRVNSQILPLKTHPHVGYRIKDLPNHQKIVAVFKRCGAFCRENDLRTTFHPDQFVLLSSPQAEVTRKSIAELRYQAEVAEWIGADVINIHGGGAYGNKPEALRRLVQQIKALPQEVRSRLALENDDRVYTPSDLLPVCTATNTPLVYDVHHHRCLADGLSVEKATALAVPTWPGEPVFHLSSPLNGWEGKAPNKHHDYIDPRDFPECWLSLDLTVEIEAKAKELAVLRLKRQIEALTF
jgi:UV DNA damage endonuclease